MNATVAAGKIGAQPDPAAADPAKPVGLPTLSRPARPRQPRQVRSSRSWHWRRRPTKRGSSGWGGGRRPQPDPSQPDASPAASSLPGAPMPGVGQPVANGAGSPETVPAADRDQSAAASPLAGAFCGSSCDGGRTCCRSRPTLTLAAVSLRTDAAWRAGIDCGGCSRGCAARLRRRSRPARQLNPRRHVRPRLWRRRGRWPPARLRAHPRRQDPRGQSLAPASRPLPRARGGDAVSGAGAARMPGAPAGSGPKYFKQERSAGRTTLLILGGVVLGVAVIVLAVSALKGGSKPSPTATQSSTPSTGCAHDDARACVQSERAQRRGSERDEHQRSRPPSGGRPAAERIQACGSLLGGAARDACHHGGPVHDRAIAPMDRLWRKRLT